MRCQQIAESIERDIARHNLAALPSIRRLSEKYGAAGDTIHRALHLLARKGIVRVRQGRKTIVCRSEDHQAPDTTTSAAVFTAMLREKIETSFYRVGETLPKFFHFVTENGVSPNTISSAFERLAKDGLIHKKGRKWIVGPGTREKSQPPTHTVRRTGRSIIFLMQSYAWWHTITSVGELSYPFLRAIHRETNRFGYLLTYAQHVVGEGPVGMFLTGEKAIQKRVRSLGDNYVGTLIYGSPDVFPKAREYVSMLSKFDKPLLWVVTSPLTSWQEITVSRRSAYQYSGLDDMSLVELAARSLFEKGHRRIVLALPCSIRNADWIQTRISHHEEMSRKLGDGLQIKPVVLTETPWRGKTEARENIMDVAVTAIKQSVEREPDPHTVRSLRRQIYSLAASLGQAINEHAATAIIGINQSVTVNILFWLHGLGIRVPQDISLVTFDDKFRLACYPISTIDWNLDDMGYKAAHFFMGTLPVHGPNSKTVRNSPALVDRGSIAPPRGHRLTIAA